MVHNESEIGHIIMIEGRRVRQKVMMTRKTRKTAKDSEDVETISE